MNTLKKNVAVLLSIIMVFSAISVTAFATSSNNVEVTLKSQQGSFSDITKTYEKGSTFEMTVNWQGQNLLRNGEFYTYLDKAGLKVISEDVNTKLNSVYSNISDTVQDKYGEVNINFTSVNGFDYSTSDYIVKYKIQVLETAGEKETLTLNCREATGTESSGSANEVCYIANSVVNTNNKDKFTLSATLSETAEKPTEAPTDAPTDAPTVAPTMAPTDAPTDAPNPTDPSENPTQAPTTNSDPTQGPTDTPNPTDAPTEAPTQDPTEAPTDAPTDAPTEAPTKKPGTSVGEGTPEKEVEEIITNLNNDNDPPGSKFAMLQAKQKKVTKTSITIKWNKVSGAKKYVVYGNKCGQKYKKLKNVTGTSFTQNKLKKGNYYKYLVVAVNKKGETITSSKTLHIATSGGNVGNPTKVTTAAKKDKVSIKAKATFNLKAKAAAPKKLKVKNHRAIKYETTNTKIATVSAKGVIKGVKKGTCYVYAYAQNGFAKKIKVTVK